VRESAVRAKRGWVWFGASPARSETPVRAAAKRRPPGRGRSDQNKKKKTGQGAAREAGLVVAVTATKTMPAMMVVAVVGMREGTGCNALTGLGWPDQWNGLRIEPLGPDHPPEATFHREPSPPILNRCE
jgi:hypothetical protein